MGISHSWNGTVLTITSDSGTSSADLKGDTGVRGPQGPAGISIGEGGNIDLTNYYTKDETETAIDLAIEEAKESGELIGPQGPQGEPGQNGNPAAIIGVTANVANTIGTPGCDVILGGTATARTFRFDFYNIKGATGARGATGLTGATGPAGYTPVKGVDYWTDADKQEIINEVNVNADSESTIPSYWQEYLEDRAEVIRTAMEEAGRNKSSFLFYTDSHWWKVKRQEVTNNEETYTTKVEPTILKWLYNNTPINKVNFGGDFIGEEADITTPEGRETMAYIWDWRKQLRGLPHYSVVGNHDDGNSVNNRYTDNFIYSFLLGYEEDNDIVYGNDFYYYVDNVPEKTRYLYLDTAYKGVTEDQKAFVREALLGVKEGWHIVAISHIWFDTNYTDNTVGSLNSGASEFISMFDSYNSRSGEYADCLGWVEFCVGGHTHWDYNNTSSTGIPIILCEAACINDRSGLPHDINTTNETAVSAIVADYNTNTINVIRVGRGSDREIVIERNIVRYTNLIPLSIGTDGNIFNSGKGWADNSRIGSGGIYLNNGTHYVTGHIEINPNIDNVIRLRNIGFDKTTHNNYAYQLVFFDSAFARTKYNGSADCIYTTDFPSGWGTKYDGNNIIETTISAGVLTNKDVKYFAICGSYIGDDSIITINEEIV